MNDLVRKGRECSEIIEGLLFKNKKAGISKMDTFSKAIVSYGRLCLLNSIVVFEVVKCQQLKGELSVLSHKESHPWKAKEEGSAWNRKSRCDCAGLEERERVDRPSTKRDATKILLVQCDMYALLVLEKCDVRPRTNSQLTMPNHQGVTLIWRTVTACVFWSFPLSNIAIINTF